VEAGPVLCDGNFEHTQTEKSDKRRMEINILYLQLRNYFKYLRKEDKNKTGKF
jgi:hypothetical protein